MKHPPRCGKLPRYRSRAYRREVQHGPERPATEFTQFPRSFTDASFLSPAILQHLFLEATSHNGSCTLFPHPIPSYSIPSRIRLTTACGRISRRVGVVVITRTTSRNNEPHSLRHRWGRCALNKEAQARPDQNPTTRRQRLCVAALLQGTDEMARPLDSFIHSLQPSPCRDARRHGPIILDTS